MVTPLLPFRCRAQARLGTDARCYRADRPLHHRKRQRPLPGYGVSRSVPSFTTALLELDQHLLKALLLAEIDLHHDGFLAEVVCPFDDLPAEFVIEPFG